MQTLFIDIKALVGAYKNSPSFLAGEEMKNFNVVENAWLLIEDEKISDYGSMSEVPDINDDTDVVSLEGRCVIPSFCDSHTHIVYAKDRDGEFLDRLRGLSYEEIAAKGGGILNSAKALREMPEDELFEKSFERLSEVISLGVGAIEIKSGYGLSKEGEHKMLKVIKRLKDISPIPIKATFLGCHAVPEEFANASDYTDYVIDQMLPQFASEGLVDYVDAFLEKGYFSVEDTERLVSAANNLGIKSKIHVNQFTTLGGVKSCVNNNVLSVDHLEVISDDDVEALKESMKNETPTFPVALPICSHFLSIPYTDSRRLIDKGLPLVIATDYNPGTAPSGDMLHAIKLGSIKMGIEPVEAICAGTLNGAAAMEVESEVGTITPGKRANFVITTEINGLETIPYRLYSNIVDKVYVNGSPWVKE